MVNTKVAITGAVITLVAFILSVIAMFVGFIFLPLLNSSVFLSADARTVLEDVYPILMILIPAFVLIGGLVATIGISLRN